MSLDVQFDIIRVLLNNQMCFISLGKKSKVMCKLFKQVRPYTGVSETFLGAEGASQSGHEMNFKMIEVSNDIHDATVTDTIEDSQEPVLNSDNENTLSRTTTYLTFGRCNCTTSQNLKKLLKRSEQLRVKMKKKFVTMKKELKHLKNEVRFNKDLSKIFDKNQMKLLLYDYKRMPLV
ncbi:PREDICTED: uncharacterized protein LOC105147648 [Acromyrmex echinatior]|uniref:uncharacterized protein LOC105147648 n=1 Tax=Acromyrmex echinatior TaxID=103372 RepID=UPI000580CF25|nr:PREDICTED: uncharacterized protein LOC105147648 [Acromyrmex echinatior]